MRCVESIAGAALCVLLAVSGCGGLGGGNDGGRTPPPQAEVIVRGYVRDAATNAGVQGAVVSIGGQSVTTNSNGRYEITGVPTGTQAVSVAPPDGYVMAGAVRSQTISTGVNDLADIWVVPEGQAAPAPPQ